jgi:hypothetical protein
MAIFEYTRSRAGLGRHAPSWLLIGALSLSAGCVGAERARARDELGAIRESMRLAEMKGVGRDPRSAEQLKQAERQIHVAEQWLPKDGFRAQSALARAQADVDLAVALENEAVAQAEDQRVSKLLERQGRGGLR